MPVMLNQTMINHNARKGIWITKVWKELKIKDLDRSYCKNIMNHIKNKGFAIPKEFINHYNTLTKEVE